MAVSDATLARIKEGLRDCSAVSLKFFLRYRDLKGGMNDSHAEVVDRIMDLVIDGDLSGDDALAATVTLQEYNNKSVYLLRVPRTTAAGVDLDSLPRRIGRWEGARIVREPPNPVVNYSIVTDRFIRVSFSETHRVAEIDYDASNVVFRDVTRVAVLEVDRRNGMVTLSLDPPEGHNPHGSVSNYHRFYLDKASAVLGGVQLSQFGIDSALMALEKSELVRIPYGRGLTTDGQVDLAAANDYREMDVYNSVGDRYVVKDRGRYIWLGGKKAAEKGVDSPILRDVPTEIFGNASMVRFTKDCVEQEVKYVIEKIRELAAQEI